MPTQATPTAKRKPGRPKSTNTKRKTQPPAKHASGEARPLTVNHQQAILAHLAKGESVRSYVARTQGVSFSAVYRTLREDKLFAELYARAREDQADTYADKLMDLIDLVQAGEIDPQAARVAMDGIKWTASKLKPRTYGDRVAVDVEVSTKQSLVDVALANARQVSGTVIDA